MYIYIYIYIHIYIGFTHSFPSQGGGGSGGGRRLRNALVYLRPPYYTRAPVSLPQPTPEIVYACYATTTTNI